MRDSAFDPPALPAEFWARPDVRRALSGQDIGALFTLICEPRPGQQRISQTRICTATGLSQNRVSLISRGLQDVTSLSLLTRIADGLDMPDHARLSLGIAPRQPAPPARAVPSTEAERAAELARRITRARYLDATVIHALQSETDAIRLLDRRLGAPAVTIKLDAHITQLRGSLRHTLTPGRRQELALVLADAAALAGWQAIDTGRLNAAWGHFETATAAAREAQNPALLAFAAGEQAYVLLDLGQPGEALHKVRAARDEAGSAIPGQLRCWLHAAEAEMAAAARQHDTCHAALDQAARHLSQPAADDLPYLALNDAHLARWRGNCLIHLGDTTNISDLTAALTGMDPAFTRAEAGLRCDLAAACHATGDNDQARQHLTRAAELAQLTGSARQHRRITDLKHKIGQAA